MVSFNYCTMDCITGLHIAQTWHIDLTQGELPGGRYQKK
jgi:hypothetical protein